MKFSTKITDHLLKQMIILIFTTLGINKNENENKNHILLKSGYLS
jgi:hypothetical protein